MCLLCFFFLIRDVTGVLSPFGADVNDTFLPPDGDACSDVINLTTPFYFFGIEYTTVYVRERFLF